ncbi:MAG: triose-phosphate isomerase [Victivallales bacterium]|jgi:triosephosphate isomerase (TIM)|nr:triose-phosphate isomerase [Victivallales bacterium]
MARKIFIAGNWKMNKTVAEATELVAGLKANAGKVGNVDVAVCPTFTTLASVVEALKDTPIKVGSQNISWAESGAFTGEISAAMLNEVGVDYAIIGHSERRQYFGETDETVNARTKAALAADILPIVCIGETLEQREAGDTEQVVKTQTEAGLAGLTNEEAAKITLAYEPVWAIGTGRTATPEMAQEVHAFLRSVLVTMFGAEVAAVIRIQYGGSMKPANAAELLAQPDIDGGLIGGASLKADDFFGIVTSV